MALGGKMQAYAAARAQGLRPLDAAAHAGYSGSGIKVTTSRIEAREDVQAEIRRLKKGGVTVTAPKPKGKGASMRDELAQAAGINNDAADKWGMRDQYASPLELMLDVMNNPKAPKSLRYQAAKDALPYCHARKEGGKKDEAKDRAEKAAGGKFKTSARPSHLHAVK